MPLKLSLKPGEKFVLNGAVVQNGDRRGVLILQNKASVLRQNNTVAALVYVDLKLPVKAVTPIEIPIKQLVPAGRAGKPEEVAALVAFLCREEAAYLNGQVIGINGGMG